MTHENLSLPKGQGTASEAAPENSVDQYDADQRSAGHDITAKKAGASVWLPERASVLSAGSRNGADGTSPTFGGIDVTTRVLVQLLEAVERGDADACSMARRGLLQLPAGQIATLAAVSLGSLHDDVAAHVVEMTLRSAGMPLSDLVAPMQAARHWTGWASRNELKAYAAACFEALSPEDREAFLRRYARGVTA